MIGILSLFESRLRNFFGLLVDCRGARTLLAEAPILKIEEICPVWR